MKWQAILGAAVAWFLVPRLLRAAGVIQVPSEGLTKQQAAAWVKANKGQVAAMFLAGPAAGVTAYLVLR